MQVQIDFWELLLALAGLIAAFATVLWLFSNALVRQFEKRLDERFQTQEKSRTESLGQWESRFVNLEALARSTDRDMLLMRGDMPNIYVRRDDYIRGQTVIELKIDKVWEEQRQMNLRGAQP